MTVLTTNPTTIASPVSATGTAVYGSAGTTWTVTNESTIEGTGASGVGIDLAGAGTIVNATGAIVYGYKNGIVLGSGGVVKNSGTILGLFDFAVQVESGGTVTNYESIFGATGIGFDGGYIVNSGDITGEVAGIAGTSGTVVNFGTIVGLTDNTIDLSGGANLLVNSGGAIVGNMGFGVSVTSGTATIINTGTITTFQSAAIDLVSGGTVVDGGIIGSPFGEAIYFGGSGNNRLVLDPGYSLAGVVSGSAAAKNTVEFASGATAGTIISSLPTEFSYFQTVDIDAGATWTLTGSSNVGFITFVNSGSLTNEGMIVVGNVGGIVSAAVTLSSGGYLLNTAGGTIVSENSGVIATGNATVVNSGQLSGGIRAAAIFSAGGLFENTGHMNRGIYFLGNSGGTVINTGTIISNNVISGATYVKNSGYLYGIFRNAYLGNGAILNNASSGTIGGPVVIHGTGSVNNAGVMSSSNPSGGGVTVTGFGTVTNTGTIGSHFFGLGNSSDSVGMELADGGSVDNTSSRSFVSGSFNGIFINSAEGTVTNAGTVIGASNDGVYLAFGGVVANAATTALISGGSIGAVVQRGGTLSNAGTIVGKEGALLHSGGYVRNSGVITGGTNGGVVIGQTGTVVNTGTVVAIGNDAVYFQSAGTLSDSGEIVGSSGTAVFFAAGGNRLILDPGYSLSGKVLVGGGGNTLEFGPGSNTGTTSAMLQTVFSGFSAIVVDSGAAWSLTADNTLGSGVLLTNGGTVSIGGGQLDVAAGQLTNDGYIYGPVTLAGSGTVDNAAGGLISATGTAVIVTGSGGTFINEGTIVGQTRYGVFLAAGSSLGNAGLVDGPTGIATKIAGATIVNSGSIYGTSRYGVFLQSGGNVDNAAGLIQGTLGVSIKGGAGTVTNTGSIYGTNRYGVFLQTGGSVDNGVAGLIQGTLGVSIKGGAGTVVNSGGTLAGTNRYGVFLQSGGSVDNVAGLIQGTLGVSVEAAAGDITNSAGTIAGIGRYGVFLQDGGDVDNIAGLIQGTIGVGIDGAPGTVVNAGGTIVGTSRYGVFLPTGGTVVDAGKIVGASGTAIYFGGSAANTLVLEPGYSLPGKVAGSKAAGATNTLELAGGVGDAVTVTYNPAIFIGFDDVEFGSDGGATLDVSTASGTLPETIVGFTATTDNIDLTAIGANGTIGSVNTVANTVTIAGSLGAVALHFSGADLADLTTFTDGASGTDVQLVPPGDDFSRSGVANVFWQNTDGLLALWTMDGASVTNSQVVTFAGASDAPDAMWSIVGIGDVTGDGKSDVLWRNTAGALALWTMNGATVAASQAVTQDGVPVTESGASTVAGIARFNGADSPADVLWRNTNGTLTLWTMSGAAVANSQSVMFGGSAETVAQTWSVAGIGDFDGDGAADVLWRNTDGELALWTMNGATVTSSQAVTFGGNLDMPDATWSVAGVGDFNGDGMADVLWRKTDNTLALWTMDGAAVAASQPVTFQGNLDEPDATWSVAGIGNYTGTGTDDVLWRNTSGALALWTMNGSTVTSSQLVNQQGNALAPDSTWHVKT